MRNILHNTVTGVHALCEEQTYTLHMSLHDGRGTVGQYERHSGTMRQAVAKGTGKGANANEHLVHC